MGEFIERKVGDLTIRIDRTACSAFKACMKVAPEAFELDEENICTFKSPEQVERDRLIEACEACPVDALAVFDAHGRQIVPAPQGYAPSSAEEDLLTKEG